jgi:lambda family phage portal protein
MNLELVPMEAYDRPDNAPGGASLDGGPMRQFVGLGVGAHEGAERTSRELGSWNTPLRSPDAEINREKSTLDARSRDLVRNTGYMRGAVSIHQDSIVGSQFRLNAKPNTKVLGLDDAWAEEFQAEVEAKFGLYAESPECWIDAARMNTLTGLIRMAVGGFFFSGEVLGTLEWMSNVGRPFRTALQLIDPDRLSNPQGIADDEYLRRGVEKNGYGAPLAYHIQMGHPNDVNLASMNRFKWKRVPVRKPWGRLMVVHIIEQMRPDQTRGVGEMVSVLKQMKMTGKFQDIVLQNAVVNATFAAAIESELPPELAFQTLGYGDSVTSGAAQYMTDVAAFNSGARNMAIDGARIPHLYPGSKLKMYPAGTVGGVGDRFEESLLRHVASGLGLSYEQFSRDYTKTNYSSARASMNETWKYMQSRKKTVADRLANAIYVAWLEEAINAGEIKSMPSNAPSFYDKLNKDAYANCTWIGAPRGQIDEMKESQAALLKIGGGVSTLEDECAKLGKDWREVIAQRAREQKALEAAGITINTAPTKPGTNSAHREETADAAANGEDE